MESYDIKDEDVNFPCSMFHLRIIAVRWMAATHACFIGYTSTSIPYHMSSGC